MTSLGRRLRDERMRRGLTVAEIAQRTRIATRHLEAIEEDQLDRLPAGYFRRAFLRQYADALGITGADVDAALQEVVASPPPDELARAVMSRPERGPQRPPRPRRLALMLAVPALAVASSGAYFWWKRRPPTPQPVALATPPKIEKIESPIKLPSPPPQEKSTATSPPTPAPAQAPAEPPRVKVEPSPAPIPGQALSLTLAATDQTWVSLSAGGKTVFTGVMGPGQTKSFEGTDEARLVVGNAGGIEVTWNGHMIETIGPRGHIREVLFTREGYRIRALRKPES